jgi:hypothetical protein
MLHWKIHSKSRQEQIAVLQYSYTPNPHSSTRRCLTICNCIQHDAALTVLLQPPGAQVRDEDLQHVSQAGPHSCNPGRAPGLQLNASDSQLVAPVVVVAHNRPVYLAKTVMTILK